MLKIFDTTYTIKDIKSLRQKENINSYDIARLEQWNRQLQIYLSQFKVYSDICIPCQSRKITIDEVYKHLDLDKLSIQKDLTIEEINFIFECLKEKYP